MIQVFPLPRWTSSAAISFPSPFDPPATRMSYNPSAIWTKALSPRKNLSYLPFNWKFTCGDHFVNRFIRFGIFRFLWKTKGAKTTSEKMEWREMRVKAGLSSQGHLQSNLIGLNRKYEYASEWCGSNKPNPIQPTNGVGLVWVFKTSTQPKKIMFVWIEK